MKSSTTSTKFTRSALTKSCSEPFMKALAAARLPRRRRRRQRRRQRY
ncbi:hypothetical protein SBD_4484 [Streptomyces bottropensis ATCC 25435]|uniref:Uncharacterized protein n=1 Tax=Streptomyces bottropensis ATCC 25435 TaxID=1054862 RepID=M3FPC0_9ACTN|nr:hypothetical protein SBD_4484 [Streptomyces bottropensis ATCC 25435]